MAKKFYNPDWKLLRKLEPSLRQAWFYIWDRSDACGVYEFDPDYLGIDLGFKIEFTDLLKIPGVVKISENEVLILDYIVVNYGQMKPDYNPHKPAFRALEKHKLDLNSSLTQACLKLEDEDEDEDEGENGVGVVGEGAKKKTRKPSTKKASEQTLVIRMEEDWKTHLQKNHDIAYYADGKNRGALKQIASKLIYQVKERLKIDNKTPEQSDDQYTMEAWRIVLDNYALWDDFDKKFTELTQINGRLSNIMSSIKKPQNQNGTTTRHKNAEEERKAGVAALKAEAQRILAGQGE